jgi:hypothetical protein
VKPPIVLSFDFDPAPLPISGHTHAARNASWTGAQAGAVTRGENLVKLLDWFGRCGRMTFADFAKFVGKEQHALCSTWAAAKELGWIVGTGEFYSYVVKHRVVHREIHRITPRGKRARLEQLRATVEAIEARS